MDGQNHIPQLTNQTKSRKLRKIFSSTAKVFVLAGIMILVAGHENINPYFGDSHVDFYAKESQELIKIQTQGLLSNTKVDSISDLPLQVNQLVADLYSKRNFKPIWTINFSSTVHFNALVNFLDSALYYGFPEDYFNLSLLKRYNRNVEGISPLNDDINKRIELEMQASRSAILLMIYLNQGIISNKSDSNYYAFIKGIPELINNSVAKNQLRSAINNLQPSLASYNSLKNSILPFVSLIKQVDLDNQLSKNDTLLAKAFYYAGIANSTEFDSLNVKAQLIEKIQENYKLEVTGDYDKETHSKLVSILHYRYYQVCLNFDRLRKLNNSAQDYLFVNIPQFKLHVVENQKLKEQYKVIVGKTRTPTPTLSSDIKKIVANPFWTVPRSIAKNEMLYKIRKDSTYMARNGYYIINNREELVETANLDWSEKDPFMKEYWIRQKNSRGNALGKVKFLFPNKYNVYLHDTPSKRLFSKEKRSYSHGCVRLQNPDKLANYLANKLIAQEQDSINMPAVIKSSKRTVFELDKTIAIHIQYITCLGDETGKLQFFNDIYKKDNKEINSLFPVDIAM